MEKRKYPIGAEHYALYEEIGQGVSASVHRALCIPFDEVVAIKILDFERDNADLSNISREVQTMILIDHPNVLKSHCSFVSDHNLWVVMPFMAGGSCLNILKSAYQDGFDEAVIATILREVLKGLEYLHHHGHIHRDVKAGNILIDARGVIKLGDFGVSACLFDSGDRQRVRNTFVGTPCWMAPEVMEQLHGYDFKADIWSFGITALELAHGHAPFSKYPPMKVLLMTLQNAPPGLDYERDKKFSKSFKQMIASCLVKDPSKRPSAKKLLKHSFFKQGRSNDYIVRKLLEGLPDLGDRIKALKLKEEDMLAQKKIPDGKMEEISQNEYKRGISCWDFNIEDVKAQASLIQDEDGTDTSLGGSSNSLPALDVNEKQLDPSLPSLGQVIETDETDERISQAASFEVDSSLKVSQVRCGRSEDDFNITSPTRAQSVSQNSSPHQNHITGKNIGTEKAAFEINGKLSESIRGSTSGSDLQENSITTNKGESDKVLDGPKNGPTSNGIAIATEGEDVLGDIPPEGSKLSVANSEEPDDKGKPPVVQQRGRFKVTSENVDIEKTAPSPILHKSHSMQVLTHNAGNSAPSATDGTSVAVFESSLFLQLHSLLQTNILQRDGILNLMKQVSGSNDAAATRAIDGGSMVAQISFSEKSLLEEAHEREKELVHEITELQWRLICLQDEIQKYKTEST